MKVGYPIRALWLLAWGKASDEFKRMCLLSSLHAQLVGCDEDNIVLLDQVNKRLELCRFTTNMRLPTLFGPVIWRNVLPIQKIDMERSEAYIVRLMKKMPCWLTYGTPDQTQADIRQLFQYCQHQRVTVS
jgi:hypothetical protein